MATVSKVSVAVLNATYEPLKATTLARAIGLISRGEAVIEEMHPEKIVHHKNGYHPWPLVIRLLQYRKVPVRYGPEAWTKAGVLKRDNFQCAYCTKRKATTVDHVTPKAQGGGNTWENTVACCQPCNGKKADRTPQEAGMVLRFQPTVPMKMHFNTKK